MYVVMWIGWSEAGRFFRVDAEHAEPRLGPRLVPEVGGQGQALGLQTVRKWWQGVPRLKPKLQSPWIIGRFKNVWLVYQSVYFADQVKNRDKKTSLQQPDIQYNVENQPRFSTKSWNNVEPPCNLHHIFFLHIFTPSIRFGLMDFQYPAFQTPFNPCLVKIKFILKFESDSSVIPVPDCGTTWRTPTSCRSWSSPRAPASTTPPSCSLRRGASRWELHGLPESRFLQPFLQNKFKRQSIFNLQSLVLCKVYRYNFIY